MAGIIRAKTSGLFYEENSVTVKGIMESAIAPAIEGTMRTYHIVYKSHSRGEEGRSVIELYFSTIASSRKKARTEIDKSAGPEWSSYNGSRPSRRRSKEAKRRVS